ncbi:MAG: DUF4332 domain-containing protein [Leptospiraceae bacterium]|nr:DUF4332 domain-containing protein [Leptospiraceae bacterium]
MAKLEYIEGIGKTYAGKLIQAGVKSTNALLNQGSTPKGREEIAKASGISKKLVLEWVNHVDLMRVKGVGSEFADLLEAAGVDTVVELSKRKPKNLHEALIAMNEKKKLVRRIPGEVQVEKWIAAAKGLPRMIKY